ncbi:hypothetical protein DAPPUDRAFT_307640 [Daphnia pulex]|uniref:Uncharacterized protein n=1 Tax=Daphnia pulex TaxID=6669 RepID=E9H3U8_DAPPU|nr:hypothetical protein DAPPUDRAFT_307640 [Daphnia pulex]|eukprot:EFX73588.1 hypothetical protein DAPPUDRAFT_307640 [Daphnia pulex]
MGDTDMGITIITTDTAMDTEDKSLIFDCPTADVDLSSKLILIRRRLSPPLSPRVTFGLTRLNFSQFCYFRI